MSTITTFLLLIVSFSSGIRSNDLDLPCHATDITCLKKFAIASRTRLFDGIPELGIKPSDPVFFEEISGDSPLLKFKFYNTTITGYNSCVLSNLEIVKNVTNLYYDLNCPTFSVSGKYEMEGQLLSLPVRGSGNFEIITGKYLVHVNYMLSKYQGKDGEIYLSGENIGLKCKPKGEVKKLKFENMVTGLKNLPFSSVPQFQFSNDQWKEITEVVQDPIWYACVKSFITKLNKLLATMPLKTYVTYD